jgi:phospholipid/cholesterol/gamma-HCH transport system substrate-binding protein
MPSVAVAQYDPRTGRYLTSDGKLYQQSDLVNSTAPKKWQDLLPT